MSSLTLGNHRGLVDNEKGVGVVVGSKEKLASHRGERAPEKAFVDSVCRESGVGGENLGGTAGGCEKHIFHAAAVERVDERGHERCLAGAGISADYQRLTSETFEGEGGKDAQQMVLLFERFMPEMFERGSV